MEDLGIRDWEEYGFKQDVNKVELEKLLFVSPKTQKYVSFVFCTSVF